MPNQPFPFPFSPRPDAAPPVSTYAAGGGRASRSARARARTRRTGNAAGDSNYAYDDNAYGDTVIDDATDDVVAGTSACARAIVAINSIQFNRDGSVQSASKVGVAIGGGTGATPVVINTLVCNACNGGTQSISIQVG